MDINNISKCIIIVEPHGSFIASGDKKLVIKSRRFANISYQPLLLVQGKEALGIIVLDDISEISLSQFNKLRNLHLITEVERQKWWPNKTTLFGYKIAKKNIFAAPIPIEYGPGPQVIVNISNVKFPQEIFIGTSGYNYNWWKDIYYQGITNTDDQFDIYSKDFNSLEINGSFYGTYSDHVWQKLKLNAAKNFFYSVKVNRSITHFYQYHKFEQFWQRAKLLASKNKCFLFQFPKNFKYSENNMERLENLETHIRSAFEFRDVSWFNDDVYKLFKKKKKWSIVISCIGPGWEDTTLQHGFNPPLKEWPITSDFIYIRFHGTISKYVGSHRSQIPKVIKFIRENYYEGIKYAFIYFNNTDAGDPLPNAIEDAYYIQKRIGLKY